MALQKELQLHCSKMSLSYLQNTDLINVQGNKMTHRTVLIEVGNKMTIYIVRVIKWHYTVVNFQYP